MLKNALHRPVIAAVGLIFLVFVTSNMFGAAKEPSPGTAGDCAVCHKTRKTPLDHPETKTMTYKDCLECHEKAGLQQLEGKVPGSHLHGLNGVTCRQCHGDIKEPSEVEMKQCLTCHNADKIVEKTARVKPTNPHTSPHYGKDLDCNLCHRQHGKSENYCSQCHKFDFKVP